MKKLTIREMAIFSLLGAIMFISKQVMALLPNIHILGMLTMLYTIVYRKKALIPLYVYILLEGVFGGFSMWWVPYVYIWTILWAVTMLLPRNMPAKTATPVYMAVCCLHGLCYGTLYAPAYALMMGLNFKSMIAWIVAGFPFDIIHGIGNLCFGALIPPLAKLFNKLNQQ